MNPSWYLSKSFTNCCCEGPGPGPVTKRGVGVAVGALGGHLPLHLPPDGVTHILGHFQCLQPQQKDELEEE